MELHGTPYVQSGEHTISFRRPWKRLPLFEAIAEYTGYQLRDKDTQEIADIARELGLEVDGKHGTGKLIDHIFGEKAEPHLIQPTFITDYPMALSPLAKRHRTEEGLVERFELICNAKEMCNAFSELNDPIDQRNRFEDQARLRAGGDEEAMQVDEDYLRAMEYGMPPAAGLGVGIDRLTMLMTGQESIRGRHSVSLAPTGIRAGRKRHAEKPGRRPCCIKSARHPALSCAFRRAMRTFLLKPSNLLRWTGLLLKRLRNSSRSISSHTTSSVSVMPGRGA